MQEEHPSPGDSASNVSACFQEAMSAVSALREAERAKKNDEFRTRVALTDLSMTLQRIEQTWEHISARGQQASAREQVPSTHVDPAAAPDAQQEQRLAVSSTVVAFAERLALLADKMHDALATAAKVREDGQLVSNPLGGMLSDGNTAQTAPTTKTMRTPLVTVVADDYASPSASACFSPRGHRRTSFSISDSVSFIPEEAFRPNADDLVSRGTMTQIYVTASGSAQTSRTVPSTSASGTSSPHKRQPFCDSDSVAVWRAYAELLEDHCCEEDVLESRRRAMPAKS